MCRFCSTIFSSPIRSLIYALGINGLLALSMYVVLAIGQLSLGQAAFMGLGAYTSALLTLKLGAPFPLVLHRRRWRCRRSPRWSSARRHCASRASISRWRRSGLARCCALFFVNPDFTGGALGLSGIPERGRLSR